MPHQPIAPLSQTVHLESPPEDYLEIDTSNRQLRVCRGTEIRSEFLDIRLGTSGAGIKKRSGDGLTPIGTFTIGWFTRKTKFHIFIGLNYPTLDYAKRGLANGIINKDQFNQVKLALDEKRTPPQNTLLGGMIGLHGTGRGSLKVHKLVNWTGGCLALDNIQIESLLKSTSIGMPVFIRERVEGRCSSLLP